MDGDGDGDGRLRAKFAPGRGRPGVVAVGATKRRLREVVRVWVEIVVYTYF